MTTSAIHADAAHEDSFGGESIEDLFARRLLNDADKPSDETGEQENEAPEDENVEDETSDESPEDEADTDESEETDEDEESDESEEDEPSKKKKTVIESDDAVVKIKVDGKEVEAPLKDLKRLYGQEASLTRKSQEAAEIKKRSEETGAKYVAGLEGLLARAKQAAEPYAAINFLALSKNPNVTADELTALSEQAQAAYASVQYLEAELDGVVKHTQEQRANNLRAQAQECIKVLQDPKTGIEGWGTPLYNDLRSFAVESGLDQTLVNELVDPTVFKLLHKAMMFDKGQKAAKGTKKIDKTPKKIIKGTPDTAVVKKATGKKVDALRQLQKSGSMDDAENAFLTRLS